MSEERCPLCGGEKAQETLTLYGMTLIVGDWCGDCRLNTMHWPLVRGLVEACQAVNDGKFGAEEKVFQALLTRARMPYSALPKNRNPDACPECGSDEAEGGKRCRTCEAQRQANSPMGEP